MPEEKQLDDLAAAERHGCSPQTIWQRIRRGDLPARKTKMSGHDGRRVSKLMIRVKVLDEVFGWAARNQHVRKIRETAKPLTIEQRVALRKVFLEYLRDREAKQKRGRADEATGEQRSLGS